MYVSSTKLQLRTEPIKVSAYQQGVGGGAGPTASMVPGVELGPVQYVGCVHNLKLLFCVNIDNIQLSVYTYHHFIVALCTYVQALVTGLS